jgi:hypothetical protein
VHFQALSDLGHEPKPQGEVVVLRYDDRARTRRERLRFVGLGALMGRSTTAAKAAAARRTGRKGGRPRKAVAKRRASQSTYPMSALTCTDRCAKPVSVSLGSGSRLLQLPTDRVDVGSQCFSCVVDPVRQTGTGGLAASGSGLSSLAAHQARRATTAHRRCPLYAGGDGAYTTKVPCRLNGTFQRQRRQDQP